MKNIVRKCLSLILFCCLIFSAVHAQNVIVTVNTAINKKAVSPYIYGRNESFDKPAQFYKDAGQHFARCNGGNNATKYNWRKKLTSHPDWYNNVYGCDWDQVSQNAAANNPNIQVMWAFQLIGKAASNTNNNFDDWGYNQSQYWPGVVQNLAGGGVPNTSGVNTGKAAVEGDITKYLMDWPADSTVGILNHWFGPNGLGLNKNQFLYWNMDNEVDVWNGTHDDVMPTQIASSAFMDGYITVAKKARALFPQIKLCGPVTTSEWQWYKWSTESIYINGKYYCWLEYFIKRCADEEKASGVRVLDVVDLHNYPYAPTDSDALQLHRIYYDTTYNYPGANGVKTINGGWDNSLTKEYIFKRINDWLTQYFGANHGITLGISEWGPSTSSDPNVCSVVYGSALGTFANNGVELFSPWIWQTGMWETLHLYSRYSKSYSVSSPSTLENRVSAYTTVNATADSMTVIIVNRNMNSAHNVTVNLNGFSVTDGSYSTLQLSGLPATETFVSHTSNALKANSVSVSSNSFNISVPSLSTTAIILKAAGVVNTTYITLSNASTGLLIDGMGRTVSGSNCGQGTNSGSYNQQWVLETIGSYVRIKNRATGLYLDGMGLTTNGSIVGQSTISSSNNLQWQQVASGNYLKFKNRGTGMYLDGLGKTTNGSDLGQWKKSNSNNQLWTLNNLKSAPATTLAGNGANDGNVNILLYPNPFSSGINLRIDNPELVNRIVVFDMSGKQVEVIDHLAVTKEQTVGSSLKPGVYIVQVYEMNGKESFKIIKK